MITDLEAAAIGEILKHRQCTAHFIRTSFRDSPANQFSDSAGSVYPMMKRLEKRGLLDSVMQTEGVRQVRYYRCTSKGKAELQQWIGPPVVSSVTLTIDPIRTRILYLGRLPKSKRNKWFDEVEVLILQKLKEVQTQLANVSTEKPEAIYLRLADENAVQELRSRLKWLLDAKNKLIESGQL